MVMFGPDVGKAVFSSSGGRQTPAAKRTLICGFEIISVPFKKRLGLLMTKLLILEKNVRAEVEEKKTKKFSMSTHDSRKKGRKVFSSFLPLKLFMGNKAH